MDLLPADPAPATPTPATPPAAAASPAPATPAPDTPPATTAADSLAPDPNKAFLETLPEDLRSHPSLARYSSNEGIARAYVNLERTLGTEKVPIPKDPNDTEAWDRYYKAGGRPDEPTAYKFERPEKMPEGVSWDEGMEGWWKQAAFESGLSQRQAQKLVDQYRDRFVANMDASNNAAKLQSQQAKLALQRDWGSEYEAKRQLANAAFAEMPEDLQQAMLAAGLNRMPSLAKFLAQKKIETTGELSPRPPGDPAMASPAAIQQKIAEFREKNQVALYDKLHPDNARLTAEMTELYKQLYPEENKVA